MCESAIRMTIAASGNAALATGLRAVQSLVDGNHAFEALKAVRALFPIEAEILAAGKASSPTQAD
jgi:flagellar biosynthesis repressor protein FlbT